MTLKNYINQNLQNKISKEFNNTLLETILNSEIGFNSYTGLKFIDFEGILEIYKKHPETISLFSLQKVRFYKLLDKVNINL